MYGLIQNYRILILFTIQSKITRKIKYNSIFFNNYKTVEITERNNFFEKKYYTENDQEKRKDKKLNREKIHMYH